MYFDRAYEATQAKREATLAKHRLFSLVADGQFTRWQYLAYLKETYHLVTATPRFLTLVAGRLTESDREFRDWLIDFAVEERGHDLLCVKDIKNLGADPRAILAHPPGLGAWSMVAQNFYLATHGNPYAILGFAVATEGLGAERASTAAKLLETRCGIPHGSTSFLNVHGEADVEHFASAKAAVERYGADPAVYDAIVHVWSMTLEAYARLLDDAIETGRVWEKEGVGL